MSVDSGVPDRAKFLGHDQGVPPVGDKFDVFVKWLAGSGADFSALYLKKYTEQVRGVHAQRTVQANETIVSIPLKCLITDEMGRRETDIGRKVFSPGMRVNLSTPNLCAVLIFILVTRDQGESFFQPYYDILPKDLSNFPIFWSMEELSWLEGSTVVKDIADRLRNMRTDYEEICRVAPEFARFSFNDFLEVRTAVGSRNFGIVIDGEKRTAMVPYADMLNHFRPRETSWTFDNSMRSFTITALTPLTVDQQVMDSYGKKCNSKFLLHYGFAVERNREEDGRCQNELPVVLRLRDEADDSFRAKRLRFLGPSRVERCFRLSMNHDDKQTCEALSFARVAFASQSELDWLMANQTGTHLSAHPVRPLSVATEVRALAEIASVCQRRIEGYPTALQADYELLLSGFVKPFTNRRSALIVVSGEKEICKFYVDLAACMEQVCQASSVVTIPGNEVASEAATAKSVVVASVPADHPTPQALTCELAAEIVQNIAALPRVADSHRDRLRYLQSFLSAFGVENASET